MPQLPLEKAHRSLQAHWTQAADWEVPLHYGHPLAEHTAVRERAGVADLSARGLWRVTGPDRAKYLQGILTNDILALAPGQGCYAALLDVKGHLQADLHVYALDDALLLDLEPELTPSVIPLLRRYIVIYKVTLEAADGLHLFISGPRTGDWLTALFGRNLPTLPPLPDDHFVTWPWREQPVMLIHRSETGEEGVHLLVPGTVGEAFWHALLDCGRPLGGLPIGAQALESLRIEAGVPRFGREMDATRFPAEAGIEEAVSYTKGCYLGQETTMRIHTQGAVNRKLVGLLLDGPARPEPGASLYTDGLRAGVLTSVLDSPTLKRMIALGYVQKGSFAPGTELTLADGSHATVTTLPFYRGEMLVSPRYPHR
jgi:folate-binding protein YgfZ